MSNPIEEHAPEVAAALAAVGAARTALDIDLDDPRVENFADQFGVDVSVIDDDLRRRFLEATGPTAFEVAQTIYVDDYWPRIAIVSGEVLGGTWGGGELGEPTELWPLIEEFMRQVARLDTLDPVLTELVRLRGARQHECRLCRSRRSVAALEAGADEATFEAVDAYADSDLPPAYKAALGLTDAMIWTPYLVPDQVVEDAQAHLAPEQVVEVVLDVARNAANKIAVALGADAATVTDGVELFSTDADGNLTVVPPEPR
ncbi:carboxymuconolactone decarboxylase family protein [Nocardioides hankookensis]|uniref:Carboxymuconolactone decarboxylase family protein n=1 Tax=Nocardioides hankookensis TaxID=443157 RepID=A0ABW1LEK9_9ACTN